MNNADAVTGTSNCNTASLAAQLHNTISLLDENAIKEIYVDTLGKLKTITGRIVEYERRYEELEEQEASPINQEKSTMHLAGAIFERRRTHSVAPRVMAHLFTTTFDPIDPFSVRYRNDKEIKPDQEKVVLEKKIANLKEREKLQQQMLYLMHKFNNMA